ncbi:MAG: IS66 family insertion sequence element accessory protein TnpB [Polyangiaceae bacterium]|nr:IS66 family insertion sequence element accessory protein TnpB [Polyangiaceae bacterium]
MRRDCCQILFWDRGEFVLYYKRLKRERFQLPTTETSGPEVEMTSADLAMLLEGLDFSRLKKPKQWRPLKNSGAIVTRGLDKTIAA